MEEKPSPLKKEPSEMEISNTSEIITRLKAVKKERGLAVSGILTMLERNGTPLSETTVRRVFADGSEAAGGFSYESTLRPLAQVLLAQGDPDEEESAATRDRISGLLTVIALKNEQIDQLRRQIGDLKALHEERSLAYEQRLDFLRDQVEKKDRRMDEKDVLINQLLDRILTLVAP